MNQHKNWKSKMILKKVAFFFVFVLMMTKANAQSSVIHPCLALTPKSADEIRSQLESNPILKQSFNQIKSVADKALSTKMEIPIPKDEGGGYTHEKHKSNYSQMFACAISFQLTKEDKYAVFVKTMLLKYAELIPTLGIHPVKKSSTPGKIFWQSLNDCVWIVNSIQAYDCIYNTLSKTEQKTIENNVFIPICNYLMETDSETFNRIHNHGTWSVCAVGMTGLVIGNTDYVKKSLYGTEKNKKGGFIAQLDSLFSPDGYYTEGVYYQRYALIPFIYFAKALEKNWPEINIISFKDSILPKAANILFQLTNTDGKIISINDAIKDKDYYSTDFIIAADFAYHYTHNRELLSIAKEQNEVTIDEFGLSVSKALGKNLQLPFVWRSAEYSDGGDGKHGGFCNLRFGNRNDLLSLSFKYTSHGLSHGHYDKLSFLLFDRGQEIFQDYGSARFLNIEAKSGGRYLPENKTFALQTVSHNTVVVDELSNFNGKEDISSKYNSEKYFFSAADENKQIVSAKDDHAYAGVQMQRTIALIKPDGFEKPLIVDIYRLKSQTSHQYDLPFYYKGQYISSNCDLAVNTSSKKPLGTKNGYQHLWLDAVGKPKSNTLKFTFLNNSRFYTISTTANDSTTALLTSIGANDPNFNLRNDPAYLVRQKSSGNHTFVSVIEPHGEYNGNAEYSLNTVGHVSEIKILNSDEEKTIVEIIFSDGTKSTIGIINNDNDQQKKHSYSIQNKSLTWNGPYLIQLNQK